jgi:hypothetical protein
MRAGLAWVLSGLVGVASGGLASPAAADAAADDIGSYPLDGVERTLPAGQPLPCRDFEHVRYRGELIRYARPVQVHPAFRERLRAFEKLVAETAVEHYGRAPAKILHLGALNCRRIRLYPAWLSEHALGNALDVAGFVFAPLPRKQALPAGLPRALRSGFEVKLVPHWTATRGTGAVHSAFLRELARRLIARTDIFRAVLGPAWPGHKNHFHLDCAPYRMTEVF